MKSTSATVLGTAGLGLAVFSSSASADYTGLSVQMHTSVAMNGQNYDVFRVYANFDDPDDRLVAGFGAPAYGPTIIQTRNALDSDFGNPLFNTGPNAGITAPNEESIAIHPNSQWDSFVTLGVSVAEQSPVGDMTFLTPGFVGLAGNNISMPNQAWFTFPTFDHDANPGTPDIIPPQTLAGWTGDGDDELRVLMMQLTVVAGDNVRGTLNIDIFPPAGQGGGQVVLHQPFQTFSTFTVPGPSALALLGFAALARSARRRVC